MQSLSCYVWERCWDVAKTAVWGTYMKKPEAITQSHQISKFGNKEEKWADFHKPSEWTFYPQLTLLSPLRLSCIYRRWSGQAIAQLICSILLLQDWWRPLCDQFGHDTGYQSWAWLKWMESLYSNLVCFHCVNLAGPEGWGQGNQCYT